MRALILIAHGSRRADSNDEVRALAAALEAQLADRYQQVLPAFLELAEPSIPGAIDAVIAAGAREVVVLPYFLAAGNHVVNDVPALVAERQQAHPEVTLRLLPHLGASPQLPALLAALV
jgi:sirohydrochlorin ferrochelatase